MTDDLWQLVEQCWLVDPRLRPATSDVVQRLMALVGSNGRSARRTSEWGKSVMALPCSPLLESPTLLQGDQTLSLTDNDTIIA